MHYLCVQVQPNLVAAFSEYAIEALRALRASNGLVVNVEVVRGQEHGPYINVTFATPTPLQLWPRVREEMVRLGLQGASIVTCTGTRGWANYVLLHHFNREVPSERVSAP